MSNQTPPGGIVTTKVKKWDGEKWAEACLSSATIGFNTKKYHAWFKRKKHKPYMTNATDTTSEPIYQKPSKFLVFPLYSHAVEYHHQGISRNPPEPYDTAEQAEAAALAMASRLFCRVQILTLYAVVEARPEIVKQQEQ